MNKTIIAIIVILIITGGFFLFFNKSNAPAAENQGTPTSASASTSLSVANEATVTYTDSGFSPASVTIKQGGTVTFVNQSSRDMWVASNPHPIHTDYPGFDEKAAVPNGGSWSFTFDRIGSWGYHNHKNPSNMGVVVVQ